MQRSQEIKIPASPHQQTRSKEESIYLKAKRLVSDQRTSFGKAGGNSDELSSKYRSAKPEPLNKMFKLNTSRGKVDRSMGQHPFKESKIDIRSNKNRSNFSHLPKSHCQKDFKSANLHPKKNTKKTGNEVSITTIPQPNKESEMEASGKGTVRREWGKKQNNENAKKMESDDEMLRIDLRSEATGE
jgi:hypothetical protein